jgi:hypothetical protein
VRTPETEVILTLASTLAKESTSAIHMDWYRDRGFARRWLPTAGRPSLRASS